jgi:Domain of unknown function (DUF4281)
MMDGDTGGFMIILELVYSACSTLAIIGWLALVLAPFNRNYAIPFARGAALILAVAYLIQLFTITQDTGGDFFTLTGVTTLFTVPGNVMLGWTHYLAFDLFIGSWEVEDSAQRGIPHWLVIPCLGLTFMFGPIGLLAYFIIRTLWRQKAAPAL